MLLHVVKSVYEVRRTYGGENGGLLNCRLCVGVSADTAVSISSVLPCPAFLWLIVADVCVSGLVPCV